MKQVELTVLDRDVDGVIEYLGRRALMHFPKEAGDAVPEDRLADKGIVRTDISDTLEKIKASAVYLGVEIPTEPDESSKFPGPDEAALTEKICSRIELLNGKENETLKEKKKVEDALSEANAFSNLNAPFADLDQLSYLTLRIGRLEPERLEDLRSNLADRAVIIPLGSGKDDDRILAASSRKGRFALDSELKKQEFVPIAVPEGYKGVPGELLSGLQTRLGGMEEALKSIEADKKQVKEEYGPALAALHGSFLMASITEDLKHRLASTKSVYVLSGWVPADSMGKLVEDLEKRTEGRVGVRAFDPNEIPEVRDGKTKVPVSLNHGAFVKGFEGVVFSYGAPLYGTIDPTPLVAFFFTILFGIMFGDVGQGFVLFLAGILTGRRGIKALSKFKNYSTPLISVGIASMVMGFLNGEIFASEELFVRPTRALTGFLTGHPVDRILTLMPLTEKGGSVTKLFYFFGFTIAVGIVFNSIGLLVNIVNQWGLKKYERALFSKTGISGLLLFWYAISIAIRCLLGGRFAWFDGIGLALPVFCIFFGPVLWRVFAREKPVLEHGLMVFIMEGFVEILETVSTYISNTVSFLRVGAFALSHAVLSFIIFKLSEMVMTAAGGSAGSFAGSLGGSAAFLLVMIFGNTVIILLEGMIVAIQVVRLQYYEFFSKFFTETGVEFTPFRFRREV
ncbi:V-type ATP synthase subunit I [Treponema primitia]|uniref:V-type ATP synthase subunit I n=1 Tax=Treponema primitia TaxID=88058 RepID=UPI0039804C07